MATGATLHSAILASLGSNPILVGFCCVKLNLQDSNHELIGLSSNPGSFVLQECDI